MRVSLFTLALTLVCVLSGYKPRYKWCKSAVGFKTKKRVAGSRYKVKFGETNSLVYAANNCDNFDAGECPIGASYGIHWSYQRSHCDQEIWDGIRVPYNWNGAYPYPGAEQPKFQNWSIEEDIYIWTMGSDALWANQIRVWGKSESGSYDRANECDLVEDAEYRDYGADNRRGYCLLTDGDDYKYYWKGSDSTVRNKAETYGNQCYTTLKLTPSGSVYGWISYQPDWKINSHGRRSLAEKVAHELYKEAQNCATGGSPDSCAEHFQNHRRFLEETGQFVLISQEDDVEDAGESCGEDSECNDDPLHRPDIFGEDSPWVNLAEEDGLRGRAPEL